MPHRGTETTFELTTIQRLEQQGYHTCSAWNSNARWSRWFSPACCGLPGPALPDLPEASLETAVKTITRPEGVDTLRRNLAFHQMLVRGFEHPWNTRRAQEHA